MHEKKSPTILSFIPSFIILSVIGWGGLVFLLTKTLPNIGPRWLFFFFSVFAVTGTIMPIIIFLNHRFPSNPPSSNFVIIRESILVGIYFPVIAWLQLSRVLTPILALLLAIGLSLIEWLLRLREKSRWEP